MLWMYDSTRRKLHCYDMYTGKRRQSISAAYMAPERMAIWNGSFFFFMGDHYNYPDNPEMHYSLFCSLSGAKIPMIERQSLGFPMGRNILFIIITISCILSRIMKQSFIS